MIARVWTARATPARAVEYAAYLRSTVVPELVGINGYRRVTLLQRRQDDAVELTVITWWDSLDAIRAFAGQEIETAVVHDEAARLLIDFDREVVHQEVVFEESRPREQRTK